MARYTGFYQPNRPLAVFAGIFAVVLYLPILFIPIFSFNSGVYVKFPLESFTLNWYWDLFQRERLLQAFWNSVKVAAFVSVLSTIIAIPAALAIARYRMPGKAPAVGFIMLPLVLPGLMVSRLLSLFLSLVRRMIERGICNTLKTTAAYIRASPARWVCWLILLT